MMNKDVIGDIAFALGIVALALVATLARKLGYIDQDMVKRLVIGANGLLIVRFGNRMPKAFVPNAKARQIKRVAGWSMVLSGLVYAGLWALAPIPVAVAGGTAVVLGGIAVTIGYGLSLRHKARVA